MKSVVFEFCIPGVLTLSITGQNKGRYARYCKRINVSETDEEAKVKYTSSMAGEWSLERGEKTGLKREHKGKPVFYESVYQVRCQFEKSANVTDASVFHEMRSVADEFYFANSLLDGRLDFVNAPGRFTFEIDYVSRGKPQRLKLAWWVVSEKINVLSDAKAIKEDIEKASKGYVYEFLSRTKERAGLSSRRSDLKGEWLDIFRTFVDPYVAAVRWIVQSPHLRYQPQTSYERADKIRRWTPRLCNLYLAMDRDRKERTLFRVDRVEPKIDTPENRFVLFTLKKISDRLGILERLCRESKGVSESYIDHVHSWKTELERLKAKPFFRSIGIFSGMKQESLVLQRKRGYSKIFETWIALRHAIDIAKQGLDAGNRPIWKLYEFWCYLVIRDYIAGVKTDENKDRYKLDESKSGLGSLLKFADVFGERDPEDDANGDREHEKGGNKCVYVFDDTIENRTITLTYQQSYSNQKDADGEGLTSAHIVEQIPDIVLTITENEGDRNSYTYLFDAKYQIMSLPSAEDPQKDAAPYKTINEMHRYRDAILYRRNKLTDEARGRLNHEVIGAYVLYPGRAEASYEYKKFIDEENIGAIPLLPGEKGRGVLFDHLARFLGHTGKRAHLGNAIPPRGTTLSLDDISFQIVTYKSGRIKEAIESCLWCPCPKEQCPNPDAVEFLILPHTGDGDIYRVNHAEARKEMNGEDLKMFENGSFQSVDFGSSSFWVWRVSKVEPMQREDN